jgi:hypothetical protein
VGEEDSRLENPKPFMASRSKAKKVNHLRLNSIQKISIEIEM